MVIVLDENVSLGLAAPLRERGHEVLAIAEMADRSMSDDEVWKLTVEHRALLITRDYHFTNHVRFRTEEVQAVIYLRRGNLRTEDEVRLVLNFLKRHPLEEFAGRLVTVSPSGIRVR